MKDLGVDQPIARLGVAWPGVQEWNLAILSEYGIATSGNPARHRCETGGVAWSVCLCVRSRP